MFTIGQVSEMFRIPISTLRYYDKEGLFPNMERASGIRRFGETELEALRVIECLKQSGLEIDHIVDGAAEETRDGAQDAAHHQAEGHGDEADGQGYPAAVDHTGQQVPAKLVRAEPVLGRGPLEPLGDIQVHAGGLVVKQQIRENGQQDRSRFPHPGKWRWSWLRQRTAAMPTAHRERCFET